LFFLRVGLAVVFLYAAAASLLDPNSWIGFLPDWARSNSSERVFLSLFSIYEIILALLLLWGKWVRLFAILSLITIIAIIIQNVHSLDIIFRDVSILFSCLALIALTYRQD